MSSQSPLPGDTDHGHHNRFSDRVDAYISARPSYPAALLDAIHDAAGWHTPRIIADIGSGTGISAAALINRGHRVFGVEPNGPMRDAATQRFRQEERFISVAGSAEATGLSPASVDALWIAQAFHWFDPVRFALEARRIARAGAWAVIVWNLRQTTGSPFLDGYEALLQRHGTDYAAVSARYADPIALATFFGDASIQICRAAQSQLLDADALRSRLLSCSYVPKSGAAARAMLGDLQQLFEKTAIDGVVDMHYNVVAYLAPLHLATDNPM